MHNSPESSQDDLESGMQLPSPNSAGSPCSDGQVSLPGMPDFPSGGSNAQLPARDALGGPVVQTPDATAPSGVTPATRELRIRAALEHGGLRALPENFTDTAGDWQCVLSDDLFERLMLDWRLVHLITPDVVERHYLLLKEFWERIAMRMQSGADSRLLAKKYTIGEYASPDQVLAYPEILRRAQSQLSSRELIAEAAGRLDKVRSVSYTHLTLPTNREV
mgnify:CR=1 FL=1